MWFIFLFGLFISTANCELSIPLCPSGGQPVCAKSDFELIYFENECKLNVYSYKRLFAGKSRPTKVALEQCFSNCAGIICPSVYQPVCAQQIPEGPTSTVPNACLVNQLICETRKQWIIKGNGACASSTDSSPSKHGVYSVPAPSYETAANYKSPSSHASQTETPHYPSVNEQHTSSYHIPSAKAPTSNSASYSQTLLASATSSDKYTLAAYSAVPAKANGTYSAPATSYQMSSSKSQQISYASSSQGLSSAGSSSYHHSPRTHVDDESHVSYAFAPAHHTPVEMTPASPSESSSHYVPAHHYAPSVANNSPQQSFNSYQAPSSQTPQSDYAPTAHSSPPTSEYPSQSGYKDASPAPPNYEAPSHSSSADPTSYSHSSSQASPTVDSSYHKENTYSAALTNDYNAPTIINHGPSADISQSGAYNQGSPSTAASYRTETSQPSTYANEYETSAPSGPAHYETSEPSNAENPQYESAYYDDSQTRNQGLPAIPNSHSYPTNQEDSYASDQGSQSQQAVSAYANSNLYDAETEYENSQPANDGTTPSTESYQGTVEAGSDNYETSQPSSEDSQATSGAYQTEAPYVAPVSKEYQKVGQPTPDQIENSQPTNHGSPTTSNSYPSESYAPAQYNKDSPETAPTAQVHNANYDEDSAVNTYPPSEGQHSSYSPASYQAPDPIPAVTAPISATNSYATPDSYDQSSPLVIEGNSASTYSNPIAEDYYMNQTPVTATTPQTPSYSPPSKTPCPEYTSDGSHSRVVASDKESYNAPEVVALDYVSGAHEPAQSAAVYAPTKEHTAPAASQASDSLPTQETYSNSESYPTLAVDPISYLEPAQNVQPTLYATAHSQETDHQQAPVSSLNIYLAPAPVPAYGKAPALNVYTIPYRQPLSASKPTQISAESLLSLAQDHMDSPVDFKNAEEISETYDPKFADIVTKWIESKAHSERPLNNGHSLGVPFYYRPSFTIVQYNSAKSAHSKK